jgi:replicative DNA helicase
MLLKNPNLIKKVAETLNSCYFINESLKKIYSFVISNENEEIIGNPALLIERLNQGQAEEDEIMLGELTQLFFDEDFLDNVDELVRQVKLRKLDQELNELNENIAQEPDNSELLEKKYFIKKEITKLAKNVVRKTLYL